jgi:hypothetical protein
MICPNCRRVNNCECKNCRDTIKWATRERWLDKELGIAACGWCGFAMSADSWFSLTYELANRYGPNERRVILERYRHEGKMPSEPGYKPSLYTHWKAKLPRWLSLTKGIIWHVFRHGSHYDRGHAWWIKHYLRSF